MKRFEWHKIEELQNEIVSFAFRDCDQGWRSEVEKPDWEINPEASPQDAVSAQCHSRITPILTANRINGLTTSYGSMPGVVERSVWNP